MALPVLQAIGEVEVEAVVKAPIPDKLFQGQERVVGHHLFAFRASALLDGELRTSLIVQAVFEFGTIEAICSC